MRKIRIDGLIIVLLLFMVVIFSWSGCASIMPAKKALQEQEQARLREIMEKGMEPAREEPRDVINDWETYVTVTDSDDNVANKDKRIFLTIHNPKGVSPENGIRPAKKVAFYSGIRHAHGLDPCFAVEEVKNDKVTASFPNYACVSPRNSTVELVEHVWLYALTVDQEILSMLLKPDDPWICYQTRIFGGYKTRSGQRANLETLAIGLSMQCGQSTIPLKSWGQGKLVQGWHPELDRHPELKSTKPVPRQEESTTD